jgi:hypothetical protein
MGMRRVSCGSLIILAGLLVHASPLYGDGVSSELRVSATVIARSIAEMEAAPETLEITPEDVRRGWVDARQPSRLRIRSNDRNGYRLAFRVVDAPVSAIRVEGLGDPDMLGIRDGEGSLTRPHPGQFDTTVDLTLRFMLDDHAVPGIYPWPLSIQASPI